MLGYTRIRLAGDVHLVSTLNHPVVPHGVVLFRVVRQIVFLEMAEQVVLFLNLRQVVCLLDIAVQAVAQVGVLYIFLLPYRLAGEPLHVEERGEIPTGCGVRGVGERAGVL